MNNFGEFYSIKNQVLAAKISSCRILISFATVNQEVRSSCKIQRSGAKIWRTLAIFFTGYSL